MEKMSVEEQLLTHFICTFGGRAVISTHPILGSSASDGGSGECWT